MSIKYESIVPWGRTFEEYIDMFNLNESDLDKYILGCGDGPASFNCTMKEKGKEVLSIDPIYKYTKDDISKRIDETYLDVIEQTKKNQDKYIWSKIKDVEDLGRIRMKAMNIFLSDYNLGKKEKRYIYAELPNLPFGDRKFDLSLSSHFLFLYTDNLSLKFHIKSIEEMLRVSKEVRIFPLLDVNGGKSSYVDEVISQFEMNYDINEVKVDYEFQKGGNTMLKIVH
ncbi:MAG: SAM-dependent methyltransferase [Firmicutes bacterium]|nr:SAM-dependent methyltransferase [Bacillota bacterium]